VVTPDEAMTGPHLREWRACLDGDTLLIVSGPDAETIAREAAGAYGGTVSYRDGERPAEANGWQLHGPWIDV
jgi:hypothetical protein